MNADLKRALHNGDLDPHEAGRLSAENGGNWTDNPFSVGSTAWIQFEDGRRDGGSDDVGPAPGCPAWA